MAAWPQKHQEYGSEAKRVVTYTQVSNDGCDIEKVCHVKSHAAEKTLKEIVTIVTMTYTIKSVTFRFWFHY
ncbi:Uncharacterised protein [Chlamydia abortus]|nr:Uncharacterised protein [Chlamydia abortus]